ncbi:MAG TPA: hypothetical protein VFX02_12105 [Gammaproteobacteria bacterium]|nr:hypothetical protein [Gammaproteobacteria bacterium]
MLKNHGKCAFALIFLFGLSTVHADGWYIGLGGGRLTDLTDSFVEMRDLHGSPNADTEKDATTKIFGGRYISPNVAFEFGYVDLGKVSYDISTSRKLVTAVSAFSASGSESIEGFNIGLAGGLPLSGTVSVIGRVGVLDWESESFFSTKHKTDYPPPRHDSRMNHAEVSSDRGKDLYYGLSLGSQWFSLFYDFYSMSDDNAGVIGFSVIYQWN